MHENRAEFLLLFLKSYLRKFRGHSKTSLSGLIRILGIGKFGEFSTITFEVRDGQLMAEMRRKEIDHSEDHVFTEYGGVQALCVLRTYEPTNPGKRSLKYRMDLIAPQKDVGLELDHIYKQARRRYRIKKVRTQQ